MRRRLLLVALLALALTSGATATGTDAVPAPTGCARTKHKAHVAKPRLVRHIPTGETGWFSSPGLADLNGDGKLEIVAPAYSTFVFDSCSPTQTLQCMPGSWMSRTSSRMSTAPPYHLRGSRAPLSRSY